MSIELKIGLIVGLFVLLLVLALRAKPRRFERFRDHHTRRKYRVTQAELEEMRAKEAEEAKKTQGPGKAAP